MLKAPKTCGHFGGVTKDGSPCTRKAFWGIRPGVPKGKVPGRCIHHRDGPFLTPHEKRFVEAYCGSAGFNQSRAALASGRCAKKSAGTMGYELFNRPHVLRAISDRLDELSMVEGEILGRYTALARGDLSPFLEINSEEGTFRIDLSTEEAKSFLFLVKKVKQTENIIDGGNGDAEHITLQRRTEVEVHDPLRALDQLAKVRGMLIKKHEVTGADGGPLEVVDVEGARKRLARRLAGVASRLGESVHPGGPSGNGDQST